MSRFRFTKGDRVRAKYDIRQTASWTPSAGDRVFGGGRWDYFDVPEGSEGVFVRSSADSGPSYKIVKWDFNGRESEVEVRDIEFHARSVA